MRKFNRRRLFALVGAAIAGRAADPDYDVLRRFLAGDMDVGDFIGYCRGVAPIEDLKPWEPSTAQQIMATSIQYDLNRLTGFFEADYFTPRPYLGLSRK